MTLIVVDRFEDEVYVIADGRISAESMILSDTYSKTSYLGDGQIVAFCGSLGALETGIDLLLENNLSLETLTNFSGQGNFLVIDRFGITDYEFNDGADEENKIPSNISVYKHETGMMCFGTGEPMFRAVYKALKIDQSKTETQYLNKIREAFRIISSIETSVGKVFTINSIGGYYVGIR